MRRCILSPSFVLFASLVTFGCTTHDSSIFITQFDFRTTDEGACAPSDTALLSGQWYTDVGNPYLALFKVTNLIQSNARDIANDPNYVHITSIEVELKDGDGNTIDVGATNPYTLPVNGPLVPSASSETSGGTADFLSIIIPASYAPALEAFLGGYVVAHIRAFGSTIGGIDVESSAFLWPILIATSPGLVCESDATAVDTCFPGQDGARSIVSDTSSFCTE